MYQAIAGHFYQEFTSRLELQGLLILNARAVDEVGNMNPGMVNQQYNRQQMQGSVNRSGQQIYPNDPRQTPGMPPKSRVNQSQDRRQMQGGEKITQFGREDSQEIRHEDSRVFNTFMVNNINQSREDSPNPKQMSRGQNSIIVVEETGQIGGRRTGGGGTVQQSMVKKSGVLDNSQVNNSRTRINQQSGVITSQKGGQETNQMNLHMEHSFKGFLRIGDIICLTFNEKVYEGADKNLKDDNEKLNILLHKITETPEMTYKGIVYSDGVTNKGFNVIPKGANFTTNASSQFKKCLFRIEPAQECEFNVIHQKLIVELQELEREKDDIDENLIDDLEAIESKIQEVEDKIQENLNHVKEENKNNEYEFKMNLGKKITYGQRIQLRHLFSQQFLSINLKKNSQEHGCVLVQLSDPNSTTWFMMTPSQKIRGFGQSIAYQDSFFIQNYIPDQVEKSKFFVHINTNEIHDQKEEAVLEINASYEPTRLRARLFIDYNHLLIEKMNIHSGDSIRLIHKEANGYLTTNDKNVEAALPSYPDFLQKQIKALSGVIRKTGIDGDQHQDDDDLRMLVQQEEDKAQQKAKVFIERDPDCLQFTNSCWEIQKIQPFSGGSVIWNELYRIKHIGSGKYLALTPEKLELTLKPYVDSYDTLFCIRQDSFTPSNQATSSDSVKTNNLIIIESYFKTYLQIYKQFDDESSDRFEHKVKSHYHKHSQEKLKSQVPIVCGFFQKDDVSKMVFQIQEVSIEEALISYQAASFYQTCFDFYSFLNQWAVMDVDDEDVFDKKRYDPQAAITTEADLEQNVEDFQLVIQYLVNLLRKASEIGKECYFKTQKHLTEQGILQILIKTVELIYYKTVPYEEREMAFINARHRRDKRNMAEENEAEQIAKEYLDPLAERILKIIFLLVKHNVGNAEIVTKYDNIMYTQLNKYDSKVVGQIFKETYKRAQFIYGDKSAAITNAEGINTQMIENTNDQSLGAASSSMGNQINKWAEMLDTVSFMNERDENITRQILYLNVISMMCRDHEGKGVLHYQMQAVYNILKAEQTIPLRFQIQKREVDKASVYFCRKPRETGEIFFQKNPMLKEVFKPGQAALAGEQFDIIFDLVDISNKSELLMPYIEYISAVIELYAHICLSRNNQGIQKVKEIGLSYDHVITCIQNKYIHERLKASYIVLARVIFVDSDPFPTLNAYRNRCYFWSAVGEGQAHRTMYKWEKNKYIYANQNRILTQEQELVEDVVQKVRESVSKFFFEGPPGIVEFLYGYQRKHYTKRDMEPKMRLILNNIETATSLIECEHVDSRFIYRMLKVAALIFISYNIEDIPEDAEENWVVRILKIGRDIKGCRTKIEILEYKTLKMLEVICRYRMNAQVLLFLQMFKRFEEKNDDPNINNKMVSFDKQFQALFQLYQFGIARNATQKKLKQLKALNDNDTNLIQLTDLQLIDEPVHDKEKDEIDQLKRRKEDIEEEKQKLEKESKQKKSLKNAKFAIYEFLLYLVFKKSQNQKIRDQAVKVLVLNFNQRKNLMDELIKIELIVSDRDMKEYHDFKFQSYRLQGLIQQVVHDDLYYLLYQNIDKEKYKISVGDLINILKGLTSNLQSDHDRLHKKQNMLRHLDIALDLINKLMKNIFYRQNEHYQLFREISVFLFMYTYNNPNNQRTLLPQLSYLVTLTDKDIPTPKLISQIIITHKDTEHGMRFLEFLTNKIVTQNKFKSQLIKLLNIMTDGNPQNQVFVLKRMVKKKRFRKRLYLDQETSPKKIDLILALKKQIVMMTNNSMKNQKVDEDQERVLLHLAIVDLLSTCSRQNMFGIMQSRKLVNTESLFDSLLSEAVPYMFKKYYFRLFYDVYIQEVKDVNNMDLNSQRLIELLKYIVYDDLRQYCHYYEGLIIKSAPEAKRNNQIEKEREKVVLDLQKISKQQIKVQNQDKNLLDLENDKEQKSKISTLKYNKPLPLIDDSDFSEYWKYLTQFKKSQNKADGLLHFVKDFYYNIKSSHFKMSKDLIDITIKIKDTLLQMSDDLHKLLDTYKEHLVNIDSIIFVVNDAISSIPNVRTFKAGKKIKAQGGNGITTEEDQEAEVISNESEAEELDESKILDIRMASDKILRIVRDYIISRNVQIRDAFKVDSIQTDVYIKKFELKNRIKEISGTEATFQEIDKAIQFFVEFSKEQQQERKIMQVEIGQEGHIKTRQDPSHFSQEFFINFRDFELLLKKILSKAGYKPPHQKRERQNEEEIHFERLDEELSQACNSDIKIYSKCFFDFYQRYKKNDELSDMVKKISKMFNTAFEQNQTDSIKEFIENMMQGFKSSEHKVYLMKILNMILTEYMPENYEGDEEDRGISIVAKQRLFRLQLIMKDCKLCDLLLEYISQQEELEVSNEAIILLSNLLCESNEKVQNDLLDLMKSKRNDINFFEYLQTRLIASSEKLISDIDKKFVELAQLKKQAEEANALTAPEQMFNLNQQPYYITPKYDLEFEIQKLNKKQFSNELLNLLKLIQLLCDNCHEGFQNYLRNQEDSEGTNLQFTSVNVLNEVANILIKLTNKLGSMIFSDFILFETVGQILDTLVDFLYGPRKINQEILGYWRKFCKSIHFYLSQDMGYYTANTTEQRAKLSMMYRATKLLLAMVDSDDEEFKLSIMEEAVQEIKIGNLKQKMVEIFLYKIGGDEKKLRIYQSDKKCDHWKNHGTVRLTMCEKDEFCQYGHLLKFDKQIIMAGFNIFIFLYNFKETLPLYAQVKDCDFTQNNDDIYDEYKIENWPKLKKLSQISPADLKHQIEQEETRKQDDINKRAEDLLQKLALQNPSKFMFKEKEDVKKKEQNDFLSKGIDHGKPTKTASGQLIKHDLDQDDIKGQIMTRFATRKNNRKNKQRGCGKCCTRPSDNDPFLTRLWHRVFYCGFCAKSSTKNMNQVQTEANLQRQGSNGQEDEMEATLLVKGTKLKLQVEEQDDFKQNKQSMKNQFDNETVYDFQRFKLDTAIRFYISNVATIEIDYGGQLRKVMFKIPSFCTYMTHEARKKLVYEAKRTSQQDKLEDFFNKIKIFQAEMKSLQRLARRSNMLFNLSGQWQTMSYFSFSLIVLINLLFIIFYHVDQNQIDLRYSYSDFLIEIIGIIQAFVSFIVMTSYILQQHGRINQAIKEQIELRKKDRFTKTKGSLGYALGAQSVKASQGEEEMQHQAMLLVKGKKSAEKKNFKNFVYSIRIFIEAIRNDQTHFANTVYFIISLAGIFYHPLFSVLLLDIINKIPLLFGVVQAISQNSRQILYTLVLLIVIMYIYSFIAFEAFRSDYIDNTSDQNPPYNAYCDSLIVCFTSTLNDGMRSGGGIGDTLLQRTLDDSLYWYRWVFDLSFFIIVSILMLNLLFGIIIDAFGNLRDEKKAIEEDVKERCFICGFQRFTFENRNISFPEHTYKEHNVYAYLYFILHVMKKAGNECTGVEKYVKLMVALEDPAFFPVNKCLAFEKEGLNVPVQE